MHKSLVAGNWKMNGSLSQTRSLVAAIRQGSEGIKDVDILILPSFVHLAEAENILAHSAIALGAQNLYLGANGAFTGEVSGPMLHELGCQYVLVGHSERRQLFHEDLTLVAAKFKAAQAARLIPILCVGETRAERESGQTERKIAEQIESVIEAAGISAFRQAVIAYEPIWAIGTGLTATPEEAEEVHAFIRRLLMKHDADVGNITQILYGGSVKADNAAGLSAMPNIDGALVGGASLDAAGFLAICTAFAST